MDWYWLVLVAVILGVLLIAFWPEGSTHSGLTSPVTSPAATGSTRPQPGLSSTAGTLAQPDRSGYEYRVSTEHYVVRQQDGQLKVQDRRRESWRAADGWTWARQTGSDPGRFIFSPSTESKAIKAARPTTAAQQQVLQRAVGTAKTASEVTRAGFDFAQALLSLENMPDSALPKPYRVALINALASNEGVTSTRHADDPRGRDSTRISYPAGASSLSLFLDADDRFLAYTETAQNTDESGSRVITNRRRTDAIPQDLLAQLGSERVEKVLWS